MNQFRHPVTGAVQTASNPAVVRFLESRGYQPTGTKAPDDTDDVSDDDAT